MSNKIPTPSPGGEVVYEAPDSKVRVDVRFDQETIWLTQQQLEAVLYLNRQCRLASEAHLCRIGAGRSLNYRGIHGSSSRKQPVQNLHWFDPKVNGQFREK